MSVRNLVFVILLLFSGLLTGCGHKGDLYLPDREQHPPQQR